MRWWVQLVAILAASVFVALGTFRLFHLRMLDAQDRARVVRLITTVEALAELAAANALSNQRVEDAGAVAALASQRIEDAAAVVASDLQLSHERADAVDSKLAETPADAAAKSADDT